MLLLLRPRTFAGVPPVMSRIVAANDAAPTIREVSAAPVARAVSDRAPRIVRIG